MEGIGIITVFRNRLNTEWKRKAFCGRHFYLTQEICQWMEAQLESPPSLPRTNVAHLLGAVRAAGFEELRPEKIFDKDTPCVLVFTILILLNHGHLVFRFREDKITDHNMADSKVSENSSLIEELEHAGVRDCKKLLDEFDKLKWQFCTRPFKLHMGEKFFGGQWILPFPRRERITEGGTAVVWDALIREEMVDDKFREAASKSRLMKDKNWYYHVAIKSYSKEWKESYDDELKAFRGVQGLDGIVQYLGHYGHDEEQPNGDLDRTWNIILEYGELDLTEYMANEQQHPPVLQREIIQFWRLVLNVAGAIDGIHKRVYESGDGKRTLYNGWHADIKPENILCVHGEFKLADFGFTKFIMAKPGAEAATDIYGGTKAFGAPEQYRRSLGRQQTKTPVTQAIDIWSFGCVLSVIATWVTLGFQGVAQYQALRTTALAKLNEQNPDARFDTIGCFHDGYQVLENVTQWHKYLRLSLRRKDTVTEHILNLVDDSLLKKRPSDRLSSGDMLQRLKNIVDEAENNWKRSDIDKDLLKELLWQNLLAPATTVQAQSAKAEAERHPHHQDKNVQQNMKSVARALKAGLNVPQLDQGKSVRIGKSERVSVRIGRVAGRKEALEFETETPSIQTYEEQIHEEPEQMSTCPSPSALDTSPGPSPPLMARLDKGKSARFPRNDEHGGGNNGRSSDYPPTQQASSYLSRLHESPHPTPRLSPPRIGPYSIAPVDGLHFPAALQIPGHLPPVSPQATDPWPLQTPQHSKTNNQQDSSYPPPNPLHIISETDQQHMHYKDGNPQSQLGSPVPKGVQRRSSHEFSGAQPSGGALMERLQESTGPTSTTPILDFTRSPYDLEYDWEYRDLPIWQEHQAQLKRREGIFRVISKDVKLKQFIDNRDIAFLVDNGTTMSRHWEWAKYVLHTLAMKLQRIDKDGMELSFTFGQLSLRSNSPVKFKNLMEQAQPRYEGYITDMTIPLSTIFDKYLKDPSKRMTVVIMTDGIWGGSSESLEALIVDFVKDLKRKIGRMKHRWFTIQFVSFGDDPAGLERLRALDDDMTQKYEIPDIIDTKPWHGEVDYMILGSIREAYESERTPAERRHTHRNSGSSVLSDGRRSQQGSSSKRASGTGSFFGK